ncbi:MAG: hypothetical protein UU71_C0010G0033, partial [Parcubacteria group bacterium GW2011_GWB1_41_6]
MKKITSLTILFFFAVLIGFTPAFRAVSDEGGHDISVDDALGVILQIQGVSEVSQIDCDKVSAENLEALGDAAM